ncbi:hypothetical protein [Lutispora saccharofermentans]|uniref:YtxH domain-containing protein n=1 Tax=Lutispora saccharofermentans TaxID=3024236 RepID=A0ABT1NDX5_9FIRM|nr:hypothetical protein [Lutispora saccharofermentans]MCQ1528393.1 hypothetical protein [Lutispora saccharofermentans]
MLQRRRTMMRMGTMGAIGGLILLPVFSGKVRKKISRTGRNAFFRINDMIQDMMDMRR